MSKTLRLAFLATMAISTVSAVEITFKRYSQVGCNQDEQHIAKDTHLHDPYCKSFDEDEPAFYSFLIEPEDDMDDLYEKYCYATVYSGEDCNGQAFTFGNMSDYLGTCANTPIAGRSVRISCQSAQTTITGTMPAATVTEATFVEEPKPTTDHHTHSEKEDVEILTISTILPPSRGGKTVTDHTLITTTSSKVMTTITLVPAKKKDFCDECDDCEGCLRREDQ